MKAKARASELRMRKLAMKAHDWSTSSLVLPKPKFRMTDSEYYLQEKSRRAYLLKAHGPAAVEARADLIKLGRN